VLITKQRDEARENISEKLREATLHCLTNESYMAITVAVMDKESKSLCSYMIACRSFPLRHNSENLCGFFGAVILDWILKNKEERFSRVPRLSDTRYSAKGIKGKWRYASSKARLKYATYRR